MVIVTLAVVAIARISTCHPCRYSGPGITVSQVAASKLVSSGLYQD